MYLLRDGRSDDGSESTEEVVHHEELIENATAFVRIRLDSSHERRFRFFVLLHRRRDSVQRVAENVVRQVTFEEGVDHSRPRHHRIVRASNARKRTRSVRLQCVSFEEPRNNAHGRAFRQLYAV